MARSVDKAFKDISKKLKEIKTKNGELGSLSVEVGLPSDRIHNPSDKMLSELGAIHEFGLHGIPERSFLRGSVFSKKEEIGKQLGSIAKKVSKGDDPLPLMNRFALWGEGIVKEYISNGEENFVPLAHPRKDGSKNPLNDTGALKQGIIGVVVSD